MLVLLSHLKLQELQPRCGKGLAEMEKALNTCVEGRVGKHVLTDSHVLCQKALSLHTDFSKGSPKMSGHIHIPFISVYCYNYSILLSDTVVNLSLCLVYK